MSATLSATLGYIQVEANTEVSISASVTGDTLAADSTKSYEITLSVTSGNGLLTLSDTSLADCDGDATLTEAATGVWCSPGKENVSGQTELKFRSETTTGLNTVLAAITFNIGSDTTANDLSLTIAQIPQTEQIQTSGGHFYEYVEYSTGAAVCGSDACSDAEKYASAAETFAETQTLNGLTGYLVTITSQAENDFLANEMQATNIWIGASDRGTEGDWVWIGGPEDGTVFWDEGANPDGLVVTDDVGGVSYFSSWASGEPNDSSDEDYAVTNWSSSKGKWNDLKVSNVSQVNGFIIEYGGIAGETSSLLSANTVSNAGFSAPPAPPSYSGPLLMTFSSRTLDFCTPKSVSITGVRLSDAVPTIQGMAVTVVKRTATELVLEFPAGLTPGNNVDLVINSSSGTLTHQDAFDIPAAECSSSAGIGYWTKLQNDRGSAKFYAKNIVGAGKVQFMLNGEEIAWVRATSAADSKLRSANGASYLVRPVDLVEGQKNVLEIYVDGVRAWRAAYTY